MKRLLLSIFTVLLLAAGTAQAGLFEDGLAASKRGDYSEAVKLYQLAAAQGNADAQFSLGEIYNRRGVARDHAEAMKWFRLAAAQGNADAQFSLGEIYNTGLGVARDHAEAMKWFRLAAAQGNAMAKYYLGNMYVDNEKSIKGKPNLSNQDGDSSPYGSITLSNGSIYVGELRDGKPNGQGTVTSSRGDKYVGELRDGKPNGQGILTSSRGDKYVGEFMGGKFNGLGTITSSNSGKYVGELRDWTPHGHGTFTTSTGKEFVGEFRDGKYVDNEKPSDSEPNCWFALSAGFGAPNGSGNFGESFGNAMAHYNNCKAGLPPPPKKLQIICNTVNKSVMCQEQ